MSDHPTTQSTHEHHDDYVHVLPHDEVYDSSKPQEPSAPSAAGSREPLASVGLSAEAQEQQARLEEQQKILMLQQQELLRRQQELLEQQQQIRPLLPKEQLIETPLGGQKSADEEQQEEPIMPEDEEGDHGKGGLGAKRYPRPPLEQSSASRDVPMPAKVPETAPIARITPRGSPSQEGIAGTASSQVAEVPRKPWVFNPPVPNFGAWMSKYLPERIRHILFYEDPLYSFIVLGAVYGLLSLFTCDWSFSVIWLLAFLAKWTLVAAFALTSGAYLFNRYVRNVPNPTNFVATQIQPWVERLVARVAPHLPPQDAVIDRATSCIRAIYSAPRRYRNLLFSADSGTMIKGIFALQAVQTVFCLLRPAQVAWLIFGLACTFPKIYQMYSARIDRIVANLHAKIVNIVNRLASRVSGGKKNTGPQQIQQMQQPQQIQQPQQMQQMQQQPPMYQQQSTSSVETLKKEQ